MMSCRKAAAVSAPVLGWRTSPASAGGSGVCVSMRDMCSWNAGTTQRPLALCMPDQLKEPNRPPHLQAGMPSGKTETTGRH